MSDANGYCTDCESETFIGDDGRGSCGHGRVIRYYPADRIEALEAENARLREALSDMVVVAERCEWDKALTGRDLILRSARAVLDDQPKERDMSDEKRPAYGLAQDATIAADVLEREGEFATGVGVLRQCAETLLLLDAENARLREAHQENARVLGYLENELQGRVEAWNMAALSKCADRSRAALDDQPTSPTTETG